MPDTHDEQAREIKLAWRCGAPDLDALYLDIATTLRSAHRAGVEENHAFLMCVWSTDGVPKAVQDEAWEIMYPRCPSCGSPSPSCTLNTDRPDESNSRYAAPGCDWIDRDRYVRCHDGYHGRGRAPKGTDNADT